MKRLTFIFAGLALLAASPAVLKTTTLQTPATAPAIASTPAEQSQTMVKTYCTGCHNSKSQNPSGGLALDTLNVQAPAEHPEIWEKAIRKLRPLPISRTRFDAPSRSGVTAAKCCVVRSELLKTRPFCRIGISPGLSESVQYKVSVSALYPHNDRSVRFRVGTV